MLKKYIFLANFVKAEFLQGTISPLQDDLDEAACEFPLWANDTYCDDENNNAACNWDGGACCGCAKKHFCHECLCLDPDGEVFDDCTTPWPSPTIIYDGFTKDPNVTGKYFCFLMIP